MQIRFSRLRSNSLSKMTRPSVLVALIVALLAALAALQVHWIGELSAFQRQQLERTVRVSTERFTRELERELERLFYVLQVRGSRRAGEEIAQDYAEWLESADFPRLIAAAYWVHDTMGRRDDEAVPTERLQIERVALADGSFEPVPWPPVLDRLVPALVESADAHRGRAFHRSDSFTADLDEQTVAFVVAQSSIDTKSWAIALLRREVLVGELLPMLVRGHFGRDGEREFEVRIFDEAEGGQTLYSSAVPGSAAAAFSPDFTRYLRDYGGVLMARESDRDRSLAVAVTHRSGSVDAAVTTLRRRNLAFGFGVVLVLAASVGVLGIAARRARRLATRQMEFVAGVSHELRTPIAGISSLSQNLADGVVQDLDQAARYGETIHQESKRLANMVEGVLHFSAIRSGRYGYDMHEIELGDVVDEAIETIDPALLERHTLHVEIEAGLPLLRGDERALRSVVRNLVTNALKFSPAGGQVHVSAVRARHRGRSEVELQVRDSGPGIGAAEIPHIFEPFFRGRAAQAQQVEGSGLGLSLVKEIVDAHRGHIEVTSKPSSGSTFRVCLPVEAAHTTVETGDHAVGAEGFQPAGNGGDLR